MSQIVGVLKRVPENCFENIVSLLEIRRRFEEIELTALLKSVKITRKVLVTSGYWVVTDISVKDY